MVAIVGGNGLGLFNTSLTQLNGYGGSGSASIGNGNDRVYVNAVTGNLVIQSQDDYLASLGLDAAAMRTYNSRGFLSDDNQDGWQLSFYRKLLNLPGTGQTTAITREGGDGHRAIFNWDATAQAWISYDGSGTHDIIRRSGSNWTYEDASAGLTETYDASGRITASANREGQQLQFAYTHATNTSLITSIQDASGEKTFLTYDSASRLTQIVVGEGSETELTGGVRVRYTYHSVSNLLKDVKIDLLNPGDQLADSAANTFITSYEYVPGSKRVSRINQTGGVELKIEYVQIGADYRVSKLEHLTGTDGNGAAQYRTTLFIYDLVNRWTDVQDGEGLLTRYTYDSQNRLASVISPVDENGFVSTTSYAYGDLKDNVTSVSTTISSGVTRTVNFVYDGDGNLIESRDQLGNKVLRSYKDGQITSETVQAIVNGQTQSAQVTRYVYDAGNKQRLRFVISPEGRVAQNVYYDDTARKGLLRSTIRYTGSLYQPANPGLPETDPNYPWTEARLDTWAGGATVRNLAERVDYDYDVRGQLKTRTVFSAVLADGTGDTTKQSSSTYVYNSAGQLLSQLDPNPAGGTRTTNYTYDGLGRGLTVTDVTTGRSSITTYDDAGNRVTLKSDNVGSTYRLTTVNVYNKAGDLISQTQRAGNMAGNPVPVDTVLATTSYFYDDNGRLVMTVNPVGGRNFYIYDALGRRVGEVSPEGALTETVYNGAGQVIRVIRYEGWIDVSTLYDIPTGVPYDLTIEDVRGVPAAPEIDLNGDAAAGTGFTASYTEGSAAVSIVSPTLARVRDSDSAELQGATARITNLLNGSSEILSVDTTLAGTYGIQVAYASATGTLTLAGASSVANYEAVLRTLKYQNTSDAPNTTSRVISVAVNDGSLSGSANATVSVTAVNDRPVIDLNGGAAGTGFSATYVENSAAVSIVGATTLTVTDADHANLLSATVTISNLLDGAAEILTVDAAVLAGKGITATYNSATGALTLTGSSSVANYQAVLRTLKYQNTSDTPNTTSRTVHVVVSDGSDSSVTAVSTVAVQAVADPILDLNGASAGTGFTATYTENAAAVAIVSSGLTIVDTDSANLTGATATITNLQDGSSESLSVDTALATSSGITVSYNAATGVLTLSGSSSVANYQALLRTLKYLNSSEAPTASPARMISVTVNDGTYGSTPATATVTVVAVNDAPVLDLNGATAGTGFTAAYTENAAAIAIVGAGLTIVDVDHANLTGATASIGSPQAGGVELLTVDTTLASSYGITVSFNATTGVLSLSGSSSVANYQALLRTLKYQNTSDAPSASRTVSITVTDGVTAGTAATATITITAVNDAPVIDLNGASAGTGYTANYTENDPPVAIVGAGLTIVDADHANLTGATASIGSPQAGGVEVLSVDTALATTYGIAASFNATTGVLTLSGSSSVANYQALLRTLKYQNSSENPVTGNRTVTVAVSDGTGSGSAAATITLTGTNDAPVLDLNGAAAGTGFSATYTEGAVAVAIVGAGLTIVDADHANLAGATAIIANLQNGSAESLSVDTALAASSGITVSYNSTTGVLTLSGSSSVANYQALLRTLKYLNTSDTPGTVNRTVDVSVTDGSASSLTASATVTVVAVNDAPVLDLNGASAGTGFTATYVENAVAVAIVGAGLTIVDADHANLTGATASIGSPQAGGVEILSVDATLATTYGITVSYNATTGVLTLSGASSVANYQALLRTLKYQSSSDAPPASRTVSVTVTDGVTASTAANATITITAVNDAPVLDLNGASAGIGYTATYTENNPPLAIVGTGLTIVDADSANLSGATATITNLQNGSAETLDVDPALASSYGISVSYNSSTGVLSLSGASSVANYQALLRTLTYRNASEAPTASPNRSITVTVSDGAAASNTATATITVIAVNDPPVIDLNGAAAGTGFTASYTENAAAVGIVGTDLTLADVDHANLSGATASITNLQDGSSEILSVDALLAASYGITTSYDTATGVLTLSGSSSVANYQALLRTLKYENSSENPGAVAREIDVVVTDGVTASAAARTTVSVVPVNDAPVLDFNSTTSGTDHILVMPAGLNVTIGGLVEIADPDNTMLTSAVAKIVGVAVLAENLSITASGPITASYFAGTLTLTGTATVAQYKAVLNTLQYNRTLLGAIMLTDRTVEVTVFDGALNSNTSTITVLTRNSTLPQGSSANVESMAFAVAPMAMSSVAVTRNFTGVKRITDFVYDDAGRQIFTVADDTEVVNGADALKRTVSEVVYDSAGRAVQQKAYASRVDAATTLTAQGVRDAINALPAGDPNRISRYFNDGDGRLVAVLDGEGYLSERVYDAAGRQVTDIRYAMKITHATTLATGTLAALKTLAGVNAQGQPTGVDDQISRILYDGRGQVTASIDAEGYLTTYTYDAVGNRLTESRFGGKVTYDPTKSVATLEGEAKTATPAGTSKVSIKKYTYDSLSRVKEVQDIWGEGVDESILSKTGYTYNNITGFLETVTSGIDAGTGSTEHRVTTNTYDDLGRLRTVKDPVASADATVPVTATHLYDQAGRRIKTTTASGSVSFYYYDLQGRLRFTVETAAVSTQGSVTETVYNSFGEVTQTVQYASLVTLDATITGGTNLAVFDSLRNTPNSKNRVTQLEYGLSGLVKKTTDAEGHITNQIYTAFGQLSQRSTQIRLSGASLISSTRTDSWTYDRVGRQTTSLADVGDVGNVDIEIEKTYDAFGRITRTVDGLDRAWTTKYDRIGRVVTSFDPRNEDEVTAYDAYSRVLTRKDKLDKTTTYQYSHAAGRTTLVVTTPELVQTTIVSDRYGSQLSVSLSNNGVNEVKAFTYDRNGRLVGTLVDGGDSTHLNLATSNEYDKKGRLIATVDQAGTRTSYLFDAANRVMSRIVDPSSYTNAQGVVVNKSGALNIETKYEYDTFGAVIKTTDSEGVVTETIFDEKGQMTAVIVDTVARSGSPDPLMIATLYTYDAEGRTLTVEEGRGAVQDGVGAWDTANFTAAERVTVYEFDKIGRRTREILNPASYVNASGAIDSVPDALALETIYAYDKNGNLVRKTDPAGNIWRSFYDELNREIFSVDPERSVNEKTYDAAGRLAKETHYAGLLTAALSDATTAATVDQAVDAAGFKDVASDRTTRYVYDDDGSLVFQIDALGFVVESVYDAAGRQIEAIRYAKQVSGFSSLADVVKEGEVSVVVDAEDRHAYRAYDAAGRKVYDMDALRYLTQYQYDGRDRVVKTTRFSSGVGSGTAATTAGLDGHVAALSVQDRGQDQVTRQFYDAAGRLRYTLRTISGTESSFQAYVSEIKYDRLGQSLDEVLYANAMDFVADRPLLSAINTVIDANDGNLDRHEIKAYDGAGRVLRVTDALGYFETYTYTGIGDKKTFTSKNGATWSYNYDGVGRLIEETSPQGVSISTVTASGSTPSEQVTSGAIRTKFVYDGLGNIRHRIENSGASDTAKSRVTTYVYDRVGRQVQVRNADVAVVGGISYGAKVEWYDAQSGQTASSTLISTTIYDGLGNAVLSRDVGDRYSYKTYDALGRLRFEADADRLLTEYVYDAFGNLKSTSRYSEPGLDASSTTVGGSSTLVSLESALGTQINAIAPSGPISTALQPAVRTVLDKVKALIVLERGSTSRTIDSTYDLLNRRTAVLQPEAFVYETTESGSTTSFARAETRFSYDAFGAIVKQSEASSVNPVNQAKTFVSTHHFYDRLGNRNAQVDANKYLTQWEYTAAGDVKRQLEWADPLASFTEGQRPATPIATGATTGAVGPQAQTHWSSNFATATPGMTRSAGTPAQNYSNAGGQLLVRNSYAQSALSGSTLTGDKTYPPSQGAAFRFTFRLGDGALSLDRSIGVDNGALTGAGANAHRLIIGQNGSYLLGSDGSTSFSSARLDLSRNHTYVLEIVTDSAGSTAYLYSDGASRDSGIKQRLDYLAAPTGSLRSVVRTINSTGAAPSGGEAVISIASIVETNGNNVTLAERIIDARQERNVRETTFAYDGLGRQTIKTQVGVFKGAVDAANSVSASMGDISTTMAYDKVGNVIRIVDGRGDQTLMFYDALGRQRFEIGAIRAVLLPGTTQAVNVGTVTERRYDAFGNEVSTIRHANGSTRATAQSGYSDMPALTANATNDQKSYAIYDSLGRVIKSFDAEGFFDEQAYDKYGHVSKAWLSFTRADSTVGQKLETYQYDGRGQQIVYRQRLEDGNFVTRNATYNAFGELISRSVVSGDVNGTEQFKYDANGRLWRSNESGVETIYLYDIRGNTTAKVQSAALDLKAIATPEDFRGLDPAALRLTETVYDNFGRAIIQRQPSFKDSPLGDTRYENFGAPNFISLIGMLAWQYDLPQGATATLALAPVGTEQWTSYTPAHWNTSFLALDMAGIPSGEKKYRLTYTMPGETTPLGMWTGTLEVPEPANHAANAPQATFSMGTLNGQPALIISPAAGSVGLAGLKSIDISAWGDTFYNSLRFAVQSLGNGSYAMELPLTINTNDYLWSYRLNGVNNGNFYAVTTLPATTTTRSAAAKQLINVLRNGKLAYTSIPNGLVLQSLRYRAVGSTGAWTIAQLPTDGSIFHLWEITAPMASGVDYEAVFTNAQGQPVNLTSIGGTSGGLLAGSYESSQVYQHKDPVALGMPSVTVTPTVRTTLDRWGNVLQEISATGGSTAYQYDHENRLIRSAGPLVSVTDLRGRATQESSVQRLVYDVAGNLLATINANGNLQTKSYGPGSVLLSERSGGGSSISYVYDTLGRVATKTDAVNGVTRYEYDRKDLLKFLRAPVNTSSFSYDAMGNRKDDNGVTYVHDAYGNVLSRTEQGNSGRTYKTSYVYDALGRKKRETDAKGGYQTWSLDYSGKLLESRGVDGILTQYEYDLTGAKTLETRLNSSEPIKKTFVYYENGWLRTVVNHPRSVIPAGSEISPAEFGETNYRYDAAGRIKQQRVLAYLNPVQNTLFEHDAAGRLMKASDIHAAVQYSYDAQGNRRSVNVDYGAGWSPTTAKRYSIYEYDDNDRLSFSHEANVVVNSGVTSLSNLKGLAFQYDAAGQRIRQAEMTATTYTLPAGMSVADRARNFTTPGAGTFQSAFESYGYDGDHRLKRITKSTTDVTDRYYDSRGRLIRTESPGMVRVQTYDGNTERLNLVTETKSGQTTNSTHVYDLAGNLETITITGLPNNTTGYYTYTNIASTSGYVQSKIESKTVNSNGTNTITTTLKYDFRGTLISVTPGQQRTFLYDTEGRILRKFEYGTNAGSATNNSVFYLFQGGNLLGSFEYRTGSSGPGAANFGVNPTPVSDQYPGSAPSSYVVQENDTLRSVAAAVYGDANLWYIIADGNNVRNDGDLSPGQLLKIPNRIVDARNASDTFRPYSSSEVIGDVNPRLPDIPMPPPPKKKCGGLLQALIVVVAIVVTVYTAGAASAALGATAATSATVAGSAIAGAAVVGAAGAAAGSIASQLTAMAFGMQSSFSWSAVGSAALSGGLTAGVTAAIPGLSAMGSSDKFAGFSGRYADVARAATQNAVGQGVNIALGQQGKFSWSSMASSAVVSGLFHSSNRENGQAAFRVGEGRRFELSNVWKDTGVNLQRGLVQRGVQVALEGGGKLDLVNVAADAFGNAIGNSIVGQMKQGQEDRKVNQALREAGIDPDDASDPRRSQTMLDMTRKLVQQGYDPSEIAVLVGDEGIQRSLAGIDRANETISRFSDDEVANVQAPLEPKLDLPPQRDPITGEIIPGLYIGINSAAIQARSTFVDDVLHPMMDATAAFGSFAERYDTLAKIALSGTQLALMGPAQFVKSTVVDFVIGKAIGPEIQNIGDYIHGKTATWIGEQWGLDADESGFLAHGVAFAGQMVLDRAGNTLDRAKGISHIVRDDKGRFKTDPNGSVSSDRAREQYIGRTPSKTDPTGQKVIARMREEGRIRERFGETEFQSANGTWYPLKDADMSHREDLSAWWNREGREYGARAPEVRQHQLDSNNYELEYFRDNRARGAKAPRYLPPDPKPH